MRKPLFVAGIIAAVSLVARPASADVTQFVGYDCYSFTASDGNLPTICAWMNVDYGTHVIRPYGSTAHDFGGGASGHVQADVRLFKDGSSVTYQHWESESGNVTGYTTTYACGGGHGWRSYNTYQVRDYNSVLYTGTFYSGLAQTAC